MFNRKLLFPIFKRETEYNTFRSEDWIRVEKEIRNTCAIPTTNDTALHTDCITHVKIGL